MVKVSALTSITGADTASDDLLHLTDVSAGTAGSKSITRDELAKPISEYTAANYALQGFWDYNDAATSSTAISITGGGGWVQLTTDGAGSGTLKTYALPGITDIWDTSTDDFDFSGLSLGDTVDIRVDLEVTTTSANQVVEFELRLGIGGTAYSLPFAMPEFKSSGSHQVVVPCSIYIGNANTKDNPAQLRAQSDTNCTIVVNGWYVRVLPRKPKLIT